DVDRVAGTIGFYPVLDRVARDCATGGAGGDGDIAPALAVGVAACELLGRNRAHDAAENRAGDVGAAIAALDCRNRAAVVAARAGRSRRRVAVARAVAGRGAGAAGQGQAGDGGTAGGAQAAVHRGTPRVSWSMDAAAARSGH